MRRIIVLGLKTEYKDIIMNIHGWLIKPTLSELKNLLANEEDLENLSIIKIFFIKDESNVVLRKRPSFKERMRRDSRPEGGWKNQH